MDIGMPSQSTPLTQQDLDSASTNADQYAQRQRRAPSQEMSSYQPEPQTYSSQNTLEAQAQALDQGQPQQGQLSTRLYQQPAPGMEPAQSQMLPAPVQDAPQEPEQAPAQSSNQPIAPQQTQVVARGEQGTIRFLPIIGAPMEAVKPLSQELGNAARSSGLTILPSSDRAADNILKGYLSAFEDGDKVNIVYVWDVLDSAGNRLHRLQGQQAAPKQGSDPWASANASLMQEIARSTIGSYVEWKRVHGN
jgi:hypothetical protein